MIKIPITIRSLVEEAKEYCKDGKKVLISGSRDRKYDLLVKRLMEEEIDVCYYSNPADNERVTEDAYHIRLNRIVLVDDVKTSLQEV